MKKTFPFLIVITIFFSCRKPTDRIIIEVEPTTSCDCNYDNYTDPNYDFILESLNYDSPVGIPVEYIEDYAYSLPVFNPNNPCQIAYVRRDNSLEFSSLVKEIWKFDFDTGVSSMIADNFYYDLDWGSNGWLIYTGIWYQVYKVKANGDSLTQLTNANYLHNTGKWNPSGDVFWINGAGLGTKYLNVEGEVQFISTQNSIKNLDWINDSTIFGKNGNTLFSKTFPSESITLLSDIDLSFASYNYILDRANMNCYSYYCYDMDCYYLRIDLSGSNEVEIMKPWYDSYKYIDFVDIGQIGDIVDDKFIITLTRDAQNTPSDITIDRRQNMVIMDLDCNNERMVVIPE